MRAIPVLTLSLAGLAADAQTSEACSPPICWPGYFTPATSSTVPANIPALYWQPLHRGGMPMNDTQLVTLATTASPTVTLPFTATQVMSQERYLIVPDQPLVAGTGYVLDDSNACDNAPNIAPSVTFQVGAAAPLPTQLGALTVSAGNTGPLQVWTSSGSCTSEVQAVTAIATLELTGDAIPWKDALHFSTLVDGLQWSGNAIGNALPPGSNGKGRGIELLFSTCLSDDIGANPGLATGTHQVAMRATLPGTDLVWTTAPVSVELLCLPDTGGGDVTMMPVESGGGCGCGTSDGAASVWLALFLLIALRYRAAR